MRKKTHLKNIISSAKKLRSQEYYQLYGKKNQIKPLLKNIANSAQKNSDQAWKKEPKTIPEMESETGVGRRRARGVDADEEVVGARGGDRVQRVPGHQWWVVRSFNFGGDDFRL